MNNEKLLKRICLLIGMSHALKEEEVWKVFEKTGSIDRTLEEICSDKTIK